MKTRYFFLITSRITMFLFLVSFSACSTTNGTGNTLVDGDDLIMEDFDDTETTVDVADPLEGINRAFYHFNDMLYFRLIKPVATVFSKIIPKDFRVCISNAFNNLMSPVRIANNLLQGKVKNSGIETARFLINTTAGVAGLGDPAKIEFGLIPKKEDLGQTLAIYGVGEGIYLFWPVIGPSNLRDTVGLAGDSMFNPLTYFPAADKSAAVGAYFGNTVNNTSLALGDYERFKEESFDHYVAIRDAYRQHRHNQIIDAETEEYPPMFSRLNESVVVSRNEQDQKQNKDSMNSDNNNPSTFRSDLTHRDFFINVGTYVDPDNVRQLVDKLNLLGKEAAVKMYDRGDYSFYGVQVSAGTDFVTAKLEEIHLAAAGFTESFIVTSTRQNI
ncbi:MAG: VacJ family lipoprotein [Thermodesulfobacteriota bacterium]|nr:VacJ family lipoprotein [Thermodesulfobacteriota bacterium]